MTLPYLEPLDSNGMFFRETPLREDGCVPIGRGGMFWKEVTSSAPANDPKKILPPMPLPSQKDVVAMLADHIRAQLPPNFLSPMSSSKPSTAPCVEVSQTGEYAGHPESTTDETSLPPAEMLPFMIDESPGTGVNVYRPEDLPRPSVVTLEADNRLAAAPIPSSKFPRNNIRNVTPKSGS